MASSHGNRFGFNKFMFARKRTATESRQNRSLGPYSNRLLLLVLLLAAIVCTSALSSSAQVSTADMLGTVTDASGSTVPGANVTLENTGTHETRNFTTSMDGSFTFSALQAGSYKLSIIAPGFKSYEAQSINLAGGDRARLDAKLQLGSTIEHVEVTAQSPALQTDSTDVGTTLTSASVQDVPLNGRNFLALVETSVGVTAGQPATKSNGSTGSDRRLSSAVSANGQGENMNNEMVDGLDNNNRYQGLIAMRPSVEAIDQVRTDINLYTAEVGRSAGAVINVITKSGANTFHGSVFEYFRNDFTDARNFFSRSSVLAHKPELRQNQYGGSIGGPILRDKLFFFADYEGYRRIDGNTTVYTATVPTAFEHANPGNLSDIGGSIIPVGSIDPTALGYFRLYPLPNQAGTLSTSGVPLNNYLVNPAVRQPASLADARIDYHPSTKDTIFGRYSYNNTVTFTPALFPTINGVADPGPNPPAPGNNTIIAHNVALGYSHIFTPTLLMELRAGYTYFNDVVLSLNNGSNLNDSAPYLIPNANNCFICSGLSGLNFVGSYSSVGDPGGQPFIDRENNFQLAGSLTYVRGKHTLKVGGGSIRRNVADVQAVYKSNITFSASTPQLALQQFFLGFPFKYQRSLPLTEYHFESWESSVYAQDDWAASARLHLNLGLRYDIFTPPSEKDGHNANFNLQTLQMDIGTHPDLVTKYVDVAPRIGFAYTFKPGLLIRGGFGLTFFQGDNTNFFQLVNPPYSLNTGTVTYNTPLSAGVAAPPTPSITNLSGTVVSKNSNFQQYAEQFNLLIQKERGGNVYTIGYVGLLGRRLINDLSNINVAVPTGPFAAGTPAPPLPYAAALPNVNAIDLRTGSGVSTYNSLQVSAERRLSRGFSANVNYTFAHTLDNDNNFGDVEAAFGLIPTRSATYDYGNSFTDVAHRFAGIFTYQLPFGKEGSRGHRLLTGGWQVNGLGFWQTGLPISISSAYTQNGRAQINISNFVTVDRPNRVGNAYFANKSVNGYLNPAAFVKQPLGTAGNAGRNQFFGPHLRRGDMSLFKNIDLTERVRTQFRVECFNITNTPNFANPNAQIAAYSTTPDANGNFEATTANGFGQITTTALGYSGRQVQFVLRFSF